MIPRLVLIGPRGRTRNTEGKLQRSKFWLDGRKIFPMIWTLPKWDGLPPKLDWPLFSRSHRKDACSGMVGVDGVRWPFKWENSMILWLWKSPPFSHLPLGTLSSLLGSGQVSFPRRGLPWFPPLHTHSLFALPWSSIYFAFIYLYRCCFPALEHKLLDGGF